MLWPAMMYELLLSDACIVVALLCLPAVVVSYVLVSCDVYMDVINICKCEFIAYLYINVCYFCYDALLLGMWYELLAFMHWCWICLDNVLWLISLPCYVMLVLFNALLALVCTREIWTDACYVLACYKSRVTTVILEWIPIMCLYVGFTMHLMNMDCLYLMVCCAVLQLIQ